MSRYSQEQYKQDKIAVDAAMQDLSALTIGQKVGRTAIYQGEYARIAQYFEPIKETVRDTARMFMHISTADRISGFDCLTYQARLEQIVKKIKSMRVFRRKRKISCFEPKLHLQPCYCARLRAIEAATLIAVAPIELDLKEELSAKINAALILEKEFENESV